MGDDYTIADIATFPWVRNLIGFYEAGDLVGIADYRECHACARRLCRAAGGASRSFDPEAGSRRRLARGTDQRPPSGKSLRLATRRGASLVDWGGPGWARTSDQTIMSRLL